MNLFRPRRPRGFHHEPMFSDERKARLKAVENRARRELGMEPPQEFQPQNLHGTFTNGTRHLRRRKQRETEGRRTWSAGIIICLIIALAVLWFYLA